MKTKMHRNAGPGVFYHARIMRQNPTPAEEKLWLYLRKQSTRLQIQKAASDGCLVVDFFCVFHKLVIEVDGDVHLHEETRIKDKEKEEYILNEGLHLIRFSNEQVMFDIKYVIDKIYEALYWYK